MTRQLFKARNYFFFGVPPLLISYGVFQLAQGQWADGAFTLVGVVFYCFLILAAFFSHFLTAYHNPRPRRAKTKDELALATQISDWLGQVSEERAEVFFIESKIFNATTILAGRRFFFISTALLRLGPTIARAVAAHEVGHAPRRAQTRLSRNGLALLLNMVVLFGTVWATRGLGNLTQLCYVLVAVGISMRVDTIFLTAPEKRRTEYVADSIAVELAGRDAVWLMLRVYQGLPETARKHRWTDSHPPIGARIAAVEAGGTIGLPLVTVIGSPSLSPAPDAG